MGILGSAFGRALAGGGVAAANLTGKYIDEELLQQRQQAFLDMQRTSRNLERADQLAFDTNPDNIKARNEAARSTALAAGQTAQDVELGRLQNRPLNEAARAKAAGDAEAATTQKIDALHRMATDPKATEAQRAQAALDLEKLTAEQGVRTKGNLEEIAARTKGTIEVVNATEDARARSGAYDRTSAAVSKLPPGVKAELDALDKRDEQINAAMVRAQADGMWDPDKNPSQKQLQTQLAANRMRRSQIIQPYLEGGGGAADPLGLRGAKPAGGMQPTTGEQGARDVEAGKLMIRSEYGGDVDKARAALAQIEAEAAKATGEGRAIMLGEANRLRMGIEAYGNGGNKAKPGEGQSIMSRLAEAAAGRQPKKDGALLVENYDERTLKRIAAIDGHVDQERAKAELKRRQSGGEARDVGATAASALGFGA